MRIFFSELIGTFILSSTLNFMTIYQSDGKQVTSVIEIMIGFFIAIQVSRKISGGHINPAVTLALYLYQTPEDRKKIENNIKEYLCGQMVGGFLSPVLSNIMFGHILIISPNANFLVAFIMETIGGSVFYLIILFQACPKQNLTGNDDVVSSLVIAAGLGSGIALAGNNSGAGLNPAISISQNIVALYKTGDTRSIKYTIIYILAPLCGSYLANFLFDTLERENPFDYTFTKSSSQENKKVKSREFNDIKDEGRNESLMKV